MKRRILTAILALALLLAALPAAVAEEGDYIFRAALTLELFDGDPSWEAVSRDEDTAARFAAAATLDGGQDLVDRGYDIAGAEHIYIAVLQDLGPTLLIFKGGEARVIGCVTGYYLASASVMDVSNITIDFFFQFMEENGFYHDPREVDRGLYEKYLADPHARPGDAEAAAEAQAPESFVFPARLGYRMFDGDLSWENVTRSEDSIARFAAAAARDGGQALIDWGMDIAGADALYVSTFLQGPMLWAFKDGEARSLTSLGDRFQAFGSASSAREGVDAFIRFWEDSDIYTDFMQVNPELFQKYLNASTAELGIASAEEAVAEEGDVGLFRHAQEVRAVGCGWFAFTLDDTGGLINAEGRVLADWSFIRFFMPGGDEGTGYAIAYRGEMTPDGLPAYESGGYKGAFGVIDQDGAEVLPCEYGSIDASSDSAAIVTVTLEDGSKRLFDCDARSFIGTGYTLEANCCGDRVLVSEGEGDAKRYGFIDRTGQPVIPIQYESARSFSHGLALVQVNGRYGLIDRDGNTVIPVTWEYLFGFDGEKAIGVIGSDNQFHGHQYLLDSKGVVLHDFGEMAMYDSGFGYFEGGSGENLKERYLYDAEGNQVVSEPWRSIRMLDETHARLFSVTPEDEDECQVLDLATGETLLPPGCTALDTDIKGGRLRFAQLGWYGFLDERFDIVIVPQYKAATAFQDGCSAVQDADGWRIIDIDGNTLF